MSIPSLGVPIAGRDFVPERDLAAVSPSVRFAVVLICVFAGAVFVFTSPVAADPTVTIDDDESWVGLEDDHDVHIEATDLDTSDGPAAVTVELSGWPDDAIVGSPDVDIQTSGVGIDGDVETDGTTIAFDVNDTSEAVIDLEATVGVTLEHPIESSLDGGTYGADVTVTDSDGSADGSAELTVKRLSYTVDGTERFPPSTEFVYRNQVVTVENLEPGTDYTLYEFDRDEETLESPVQSVTPGGSTTATIDTDDDLEAGWYIVYDGDEIVPAEENAFQLRTQELEATPADETVASEGEDAETSVTIDSPLRSTAFDVNVSSADLDADELFEIFEGETNGDVEHVEDSDSKIVVRDVEAGEEIPLTFEPVLEATYTFEFEAIDTGASDETAVGVEERELAAQFGSDLFETEAGNIVEIDLSLEDTDEAFVMIGGDRASGDRVLQNYFDLLHVEGDTTVRINTRLLGTNVPSEEVYTAESGEVTSYLQQPDHDGFDGVTFEDADDLSSFRSEIGVGSLPRPLQPDRYRLVAGASGDVVIRDDGVPDFERPLDRSNLLITDTDGFGNVTTYVAPEGSANEFEGEDELDDLRAALTERRTVAKGDRLVFEIEADGITGLVSWLDERFGGDDIEINHETLSTLLSFPDGVVLDAEQTNPDRNEPVTRLDIDGATDGDLYALHEPAVERGDQLAIERYFLVLDTRETGPFDAEIDPGEEYRFRFGYNSSGETDWFDAVDHDAVDPGGAAPHFPYHDADAENRTETRHVTVEEREIAYDRIDARDRPILRSESEATISGRTNLAPGTEMSVQLIASNRTDPTRITIDEIDVEPDGTFNVTQDLSALDAGEPLEMEVYVEEELFDKRPAVVAPEGVDLIEYEIVEHTEISAIAPGESLSDVSATIENTGYVPGGQFVELSVDGEPIDEQFLRLDEEEVTSVGFKGAVDLDPGRYTYTIETADDETTGQLIIEADDVEADEDESDADDPGSSPPDDDADEQTDEQEDDTDDQNDEMDDSDDPPEEEPGDDSLVAIGLAGAVGARHAIGGAAIVAGVHVLGHWT